MPICDVATCHKQLKLFSGGLNRPLAEEMAEYLELPLGEVEIGRFSNGETQIRIRESVRGIDAFVVQPTVTDQGIIELLIIIDALKRASAQRITAVIPFYGYARQDRKTRGREPITAKLMANLVTAAGADRILTMDLHAGQIQGFFDIPVDHLRAVPILADYIKEKKLENIAVVSPDLGGVTRARELATRLNAPLAIIDKRRPAPNQAEIMNVIGDIKGKTVVMTDDIIDTAGTITLGADALIELGAKEVYACCTHPVLSGPAIERLQKSAIKELIVTNTIDLEKEKMIDKIRVLSVAPLFAEVIKRIYENIPVSSIFDDNN